MRIPIFVLGFISLISLACAVQAQEESLVLYFSFDEEVEDEIADLSIHENHGQISGEPEWDAGKIGQALNFDAVNDQIVVPTSNSLDIEDEITIMAWVNPGDALLADWRTIIGKSPTNVLGQTTFSYDIRTDMAGTYRFSLNMGGWQNIIGPIAEIGKWTHVAGTYDGGEMAFYLDGELVEAKPANGEILITADPVSIGNIVNAGGASQNEFWAGLIDEVRVWNRGLSEAEVKQQMDLQANDILAVSPRDKLAVTWAGIKNGR